jgi:hypothetical protein
MKAFLSYTRIKNQFNAVTELHAHLANELQLHDPKSQLFLDTVNISEGDHFPEVLKIELSQTDVMIVLLSPAWLKSEWCRREFELFTEQRQNESRSQRILPLLFVDTPTLSSDSNDPIAALLSQVNYVDWRDLRHESWQNSEKLRQIAKIAARVTALATNT